MPIFNRGIESKSAYDELIKLEKTIYTRIPGGVIMNNYSFVCLCIQAGNYKRAYQHMEAIVKQNIGDHNFNQYIAECKNKNDLYLERFSSDIQNRIKLLNMLAIPDIEYCRIMVAQNSIVSREYLSYPNKYKFGREPP
jgi:DNA-directed RNA polymerase